ncbi:MAG: hypothetical protein QM733_18330 [Ilumatobacteraceae bacterium]
MIVGVVFVVLQVVGGIADNALGGTGFYSVPIVARFPRCQALTRRIVPTFGCLIGGRGGRRRRPGRHVVVNAGDAGA